VKERYNYFQQSEPLTPGDVVIIFIGSQPWPPPQHRGHQVTLPEIPDLLLTHLHLDHHVGIPHLRRCDPFNGRWKPLRIMSPSG
jgi:ribonuclease Z